MYTYKKKIVVALLGCLLFLGGCTVVRKSPMTSFFITSSDFTANQLIPAQFTCDGENTNPALSWDGVPKGTQSLAFIMDDPDSPSGLWTHWILYNIPPTTTNIERRVKLSVGEQGKNTFGNFGYGGPCPHQGKHRYVFTLFALDTMLTLAHPERKNIDMAMKGHILSSTSLMGTYERTQK